MGFSLVPRYVTVSDSEGRCPSLLQMMTNGVLALKLPDFFMTRITVTLSHATIHNPQDNKLFQGKPMYYGPTYRTILQTS